MKIIHNFTGNCTSDAVAAVERLSDGDTLCFEKGEYHFYKDGTKQIVLGPSGNIAGMKNVAISLVGRRNIVIDGGGSTFVIHNGVFPLAAIDVESIKVCNFTLKAAVPSVAEFKVREVSDSGFVLDFAPSGPKCELTDGSLVFDVDGVKFSTFDHKFSLHALDRCQIYYLFCGGHDENRDVLATAFVSADAVEKKGSSIRFVYRHDEHPKCLRKFPYDVGESVALLIESDRHRDQLFFCDCSNVVVENVRIESGVGMGIIAQHCNNVKIDGYSAVPSEGSRVALTADAMYISSCGGDIEVARSHIVGGLDDPLNIHCVYTVLTAVDQDRITVSAWHDRLRDGFFPYAEGDELEFFSWQNGKRVCRGNAVVKSFVRPDMQARTAELVLDREIPQDWIGLRVGNISHQPKVWIHDNRFEGTLNFRLSAYGDITVEDNSYRKCKNVIYANDLTDWAGEGGPIRKLTVRRNKIDQCWGNPLDVVVPPLEQQF